MQEEFPRNIRKGVIKKPPPTPNNPDKIPTTKLRKNINGRLDINFCYWKIEIHIK